MKYSIPIIVTVLLVGCAALYSQNMDALVQSSGDFSLENIAGKSAVISAAELLSGEKSIFIEFGADSCLVAELSRRSERYTVEIVSFMNPKGAMGAFSASGVTGEYSADVGDKARKNDVHFQFVKSAMIATIIPIGDAGMSGAEALAMSLSERTKTIGIATDMYSSLPRSNIVPGSEFYFMGKRMFSKHFSPELAGDLAVENIKEGVAAKYHTDDGDIDFIKIRYYKPEFAKDAVNSFLRSRSEMPVILPRETLQFYTIMNPDRFESYIADYAEWVLVMPSSPPGSKGRALFEYFLRGGR